jgi:hypothetical protein
LCLSGGADLRPAGYPLCSAAGHSKATRLFCVLNNVQVHHDKMIRDKSLA